jgi:two-component system sensor histidine kinase/response regulator
MAQHAQDTCIVTEPVINLAVVMQRIGCDASLLREIATLFLAHCPTRMTELRAALARHDRETLERTAHSLKGSMSNFAATRAVHAAARLEYLAHAGDLTAATEAYAVLEREVACVRDALAALC